MKLHNVLFLEYNYSMTDIDNTHLGTIVDSRWLQQEERLQNIDSIFDREQMQSITVKCIYINTAKL